MNLIINTYERLMRTRWEIGFISGGIEAVMSGEQVQIDYIKNPYNDRWFADPFILSNNNGEIRLLVEEFPYSTGKGTIVLLVVSESSLEIKERRTILELPTHLSFPAIIRKEGRILVYPENSAGGVLALYDITDSITNDAPPTKVQVLLKESVSDSIMTDYFGERLIFTTKTNDTLQIYMLSDGSSQLVQELFFPDITARNAGDFFQFGGKLYRPAQICKNHYGEGIEIQEIEQVETGRHYIIKTISRLIFKHPTLKLGFHTLNVYENLAVTDVHGYNYPLFAYTANGLKNLIMGENWHRRNRNNKK